MQVNLKQAEIERAIKGFLANEGIALHGRKVSIHFTAGRGENKISAEVDIEESDLPVFTDTSVDAAAPVAKPPLAVVSISSDPSNVSEETPKAVETVESTQESKPKASSLFG